MVGVSDGATVAPVAREPNKHMTNKIRNTNMFRMVENFVLHETDIRSILSLDFTCNLLFVAELGWI